MIYDRRAQRFQRTTRSLDDDSMVRTYTNFDVNPPLQPWSDSKPITCFKRCISHTFNYDMILRRWKMLRPRFMTGLSKR